MDAVPLDPGNYRGTYKLVGGQPSLDLVNTVSWPGRPNEHDWLDPIENVTAWAAAAGVLDPKSAERLRKLITADSLRSSRELATARRIRSTIRAVLDPYVRGKTVAPEWLDDLNRLVVRAASRRSLVKTDRGRAVTWSFEEPASVATILAPVVLNAADLLTELDRTRLGYCPSCDWLFHDTTRNGQRIWCDMADCGSRAKARRHYQRHHG